MAEVQNMSQMNPAKMPLSLRTIGWIMTMLERSGEEKEKMRLISIAISHYVEKVRWALELGSRPWTEDGHLPGLHCFFTFPVTGDKSMTPCLVTRDKTEKEETISDSTLILKYLCRTDPNLRFLYPQGKEDEVEHWEDYFDQRIGVPMRRFAYSIILRHKPLAFKILGAELPWIEQKLIPIVYPDLVKGLQKEIAVDVKGTQAIEESVKIIDEVFATVEEKLSKAKYLCGDSFTAADIAFASLCYPIVATGLPDVWDTRWPSIEEFPENYQRQILKWLATAAGKHAVFIYREHRFKTLSTSHKVQISNPNSRNNFWPLILAAVSVTAITVAGVIACRSK